MNLPFETEVAFEVPVMFANSCNVSFEKAETGKRGSRLSYTPHNANTQTRDNFLTNSGYFSAKGWVLRGS
jgi:hypothetical protein